MHLGVDLGKAKVSLVQFGSGSCCLSLCHSENIYLCSSLDTFFRTIISFYLKGQTILLTKHSFNPLVYTAVPGCPIAWQRK